MILTIQSKFFSATILQKIFSIVLKENISVLCLKYFTNEWSKKYFNVWQKMQIGSTGININFYEIWQKLTSGNLLKFNLVLIKTYREKEKMTYICTFGAKVCILNK